MRSALVFAVLAIGCVVNAEPPACREPTSVAFSAERIEATCEDFTPPDLADCLQTRGRFDLDSCIVEGEYFCGGGVRAAVRFVFCAGEPASGVEVFRRISDGCRVEILMVEAQ